MMRSISFLAFFMFAGANSKAACFQAIPLLPPSKEVKAYVGDTPEGLDVFGESPYGRAHAPYPPAPPRGLASPESIRVVADRAAIKVWYFEPKGKMQASRICRVDSWVSKGATEQPQSFFDEMARNARGDVLTENLLKRGLTKLYTNTYVYDEKGRIVRIEQSDFTKGTPSASKALHCRRYDERDRVILWVKPEHTMKCPSGEPSLKDQWREYRFATVDGKDVQLRHRWHFPDEKDQWREEWAPFQIDSTPESVRGHAYVDAPRGVKEIFGSNYGKRDNNAANMVLDVFGRWQGSTYYFTKPPVPLSVLENPDEIYKYERRRMTRLDNQYRMYELFKPNEHISTHRIYMLEGYVLRHEQLDAQGKINRIITVNDWRQPRPGPKPDFDDSRLSSKVPRLLAHQIYHRVYDVDAKGQPTLVAVSWNRAVLNPLKKTPLSVADLVFGTPDGTPSWKNQDEFDAAFNTSGDARQVFPDMPDDEQ
ncbi:hypothetical protein [Pseudoduganella sp.]|uniref:hypothetical protein n=1 Tax=Pseudoduganella sp. TaxID=1880898 RepID=UPI0035B06D78